MNTGVRDLEVAFFKANSTRFDDKCSKDLSNRPVYAVLNTHNLFMILQLKYLTIRPVARKGYGSIAHEAKPNGLLTRGP